MSEEEIGFALLMIFEKVNAPVHLRKSPLCRRIQRLTRRMPPISSDREENPALLAFFNELRSDNKSKFF